jgi:hypothetical protein
MKFFTERAAEDGILDQDTGMHLLDGGSDESDPKAEKEEAEHRKRNMIFVGYMIVAVTLLAIGYFCRECGKIAESTITKGKALELKAKAARKPATAEGASASLKSN